MRLRQLLKDDDAVSPVIGVILMVAITVILAAVIASFVLGLGDSADEVAPNAGFSFDLDEDATDEELTITHDSGDSIPADELYVRGEHEATDEEWYENDDDTFETNEIGAGDRITIEVNPDDYDVSVVWDNGDGNTATLSQDSS